MRACVRACMGACVRACVHVRTLCALLYACWRLCVQVTSQQYLVLTRPVDCHSGTKQSAAVRERMRACVVRTCVRACVCVVCAVRAFRAVRAVHTCACACVYLLAASQGRLQDSALPHTVAGLCVPNAYIRAYPNACVCAQLSAAVMAEFAADFDYTHVGASTSPVIDPWLFWSIHPHAHMRIHSCASAHVRTRMCSHVGTRLQACFLWQRSRRTFAPVHTSISTAASTRARANARALFFRHGPHFPFPRYDISFQYALSLGEFPAGGELCVEEAPMQAPRQHPSSL